MSMPMAVVSISPGFGRLVFGVSVSLYGTPEGTSKVLASLEHSWWFIRAREVGTQEFRDTVKVTSGTNRIPEPS